MADAKPFSDEDLKQIKKRTNLTEFERCLLANITADQKRIEELEKRPEEIYQGELVALRGQIGEAAEEIHCAGTVAHRIRVLKQQQADTIERLEGQLENIHDIAVGYDGYGNDVEKLKGLIDELREIARQGLGRE